MISSLFSKQYNQYNSVLDQEYVMLIGYSRFLLRFLQQSSFLQQICTKQISRNSPKMENATPIPIDTDVAL